MSAGKLMLRICTYMGCLPYILYTCIHYVYVCTTACNAHVAVHVTGIDDVMGASLCTPLACLFGI